MQFKLASLACYLQLVQLAGYQPLNSIPLVGLSTKLKFGARDIAHPRTCPQRLTQLCHIDNTRGSGWLDSLEHFPCEFAPECVFGSTGGGSGLLHLQPAAESEVYSKRQVVKLAGRPAKPCCR